MTEAVFNDGRQTLASGAKGRSGVSAAIAELTRTPQLSPTVILG